MDLHAALTTHFGHEEFRPGQEEIIRSVMEGRSVLGVLPTGAGKSLCYQLPAMLLARPTLVVSPLVALMKDQLDGLPPAVYPKATLINSSIDLPELDRRLEAIDEGRFRLIYAAPERLRQEGFLRRLVRTGLSLVVVDEAHCVSVWGHDFRPDYLFIRKALDALSESGDPPGVLALTATATPEMQSEIAEQLGRPLETFAASTFRSNLRLEVFRCGNADDKMRRLVTACKETPGATIVYATSRERCEKLAVFLRGQGLPAAYYHAGLDRDERERTQERFMLGRTPIIVATVAFGMGVDKSNVRLVAHFSMPQSLEAYTQEAGRAGRDGRAARCVLLYAASDKAALSRWQRQEQIDLETVRDVYRALQAQLGKGSGRVAPDELMTAAFGEAPDAPGADTRLRVAISALERCSMVARHPDAGRDMRIEMLAPPRSSRADLEALLAQRRRQSEHRLDELVAYVEGPGCRHVAIARHFGQDLAPCGNACDRCLGTVQEPQEPRAAAPTVEELPDLGRAVLETLVSLPFGVGRTGLVKVLVGAADSAIKKDRCERHGCLAGFSASALERSVEHLVEEGLLTRDPNDEYRRLSVSSEGRAALESERILLANPGRTSAPDRRSPSGTPSSDDPLNDEEADRFEQLRAWRRIEANNAGVPPYVVFHDSTLRALARANPLSVSDLEPVAGLGPKKIEAYGTAVLAVLRGDPFEGG